MGDDTAKGSVLGQGEFRLPGHGCGGDSASSAVLVLVDAGQEELVPSLSPRVEGAAHWSASNRHGLGYGGRDARARAVAMLLEAVVVGLILFVVQAVGLLCPLQPSQQGFPAWW